MVVTTSLTLTQTVFYYTFIRTNTITWAHISFTGNLHTNVSNNEADVFFMVPTLSSPIIEAHTLFWDGTYNNVFLEKDTNFNRGSTYTRQSPMTGAQRSPVQRANWMKHCKWADVVTVTGDIGTWWLVRLRRFFTFGLRDVWSNLRFYLVSI